MKSKKLLFMIFTLVCFLAAGVCLIVNMAINQQITWAAYPILSISFGWAVLSLLFVKKHGIILLFCALTLLLPPYLYFISKITPVTDWFMPIGLPSAIAGIIASWILFLLFRLVKINIWYKLAISVFLLGVVISPIIVHFVELYLEAEPSHWYSFLKAFICIIASAVLGMLGFRKSKTDQNHIYTYS